MPRRLLTIAAAILTSACASGGQSSDTTDITVVVSNEFPSTVTAYAVWDGRRTRLGELRTGRERTFSTPRRGDRVALGVEVVSTPPPGTSGGANLFGGGGGADPSAPFFRSEAIVVSPNEGIEWQITPQGTILFRRLSD